jgi:hypothetical protein
MYAEMYRKKFANLPKPKFDIGVAPIGHINLGGFTKAPSNVKGVETRGSSGQVNNVNPAEDIWKAFAGYPVDEKNNLPPSGYAKYTGGGWYTMPNGKKVRGKDNLPINILVMPEDK